MSRNFTAASKLYTENKPPIVKFQNWRYKQLLALLAELCEKAEINKSTFYKHYTDVFNLSSELEAETIERILENLPHPEYILKRPRDFMEEMLAACLSQSTIIDRLFLETKADILS